MPTKSKRRLQLLGMKFCRLLVIAEAGKDKYNQALWKCKCNCGNETLVRSTSLVHGKIKSCGCLRTEAVKKAKITHGKVKTPLYRRWVAMRQRCNNANYSDYCYYGGRGIRVCDRWNDFTLFAKDMGDTFQKELHLERMDNDGNYSPDNCVWATRKQQARNQRNNHRLEFNGEVYVISEWAERMNISYATLLARLRRGWEIERALTKPVGKYNRK